MTRLLDQVQNLRELEAFDAPGFLQATGAELAALPSESLADLGAKLDQLRDWLDAVDRFAQKCMAIHLNQLATDPLPPQLRTLLKTTVIAYDRSLELLRGRVATALARIDRSTAGEVTDRVMSAAESVLALRRTLRNGIFDLAVDFAGERLKRPFGDRSLPPVEKQRFGQARIDLQQVAAQPGLLELASFAERLKKIPPPEEEPETESTEEKRFSLLEID